MADRDEMVARLRSGKGLSNQEQERVAAEIGRLTAEIGRLTAENQELREAAVLPDGYVVTYATEFANGTIQLTCKPEVSDG